MRKGENTQKLEIVRKLRKLLLGGHVVFSGKQMQRGVVCCDLRHEQLDLRRVPLAVKYTFIQQTFTESLPCPRNWAFMPGHK